MNTLQHSKLAWYNQSISYFVLDLVWAIVVSLVVYVIHSDVTTASTLLVWNFTLVFFWQASAAPLRLFSQSYRHPVRLIFSVVMVSLCYFLILRSNYSIVSLFLVSMGWLFGAIWIRYCLSQLKSSIRVLGHPLVLDLLEDSDKYQKIICTTPEVINLAQFDCVVFDPKFNYSKDWQEFFVHISTIGVPVFSLSELQELVHGKVPVELLQIFWIDQSFVCNRFYIKLKRFIDIFLIILFLPIILIFTLITISLIKLFMGNPVLFKQYRVGLAGEIFTIYKFRTMETDEVEVGLDSAATETMGNLDPRITPLGRIIRKFRLDELPQLYNVLLGDMSLIGPRPEWLKTAAQYADEIPLYQLRHIVRPGLTGWAQVQQGHTIGVTGNYEKLRYDIYYVKHCSIWLDLKIIAKTVQVLAFAKGV